jgi:glycosyltransferase involved in cell wall biosynthesis
MFTNTQHKQEQENALQNPFLLTFMKKNLIQYPSSHKFELKPESESSVAIIMRTKDRPILLVRGLSSVLNQIFSDWHLFIINDGGDPIVFEETLKPYRQRFENKISVIHNEISHGMEAASNVAIRAVLSANKGEEVAGVTTKRRFAFGIIHDDDDSWHPDFLLETVSFLEREENLYFGGVCSRVTLVEEEIRGTSIHILREIPYHPEVKEINLWNLMKGNPSCPISFLFRIELFENLELFNEKMPVYGDWDFFLRVSQFSDIGFLEKSLAYYHQRPIAKNDGSGSYANSVFSAKKDFEKCKMLYESSIFRNSILTTNKEPNGFFGILFALANLEKTVSWQTWQIRQKLNFPLASNGANSNIACSELHSKIDTLWIQTQNIHEKLDRGFEVMKKFDILWIQTQNIHEKLDRLLSREQEEKQYAPKKGILRKIFSIFK